MKEIENIVKLLFINIVMQVVLHEAENAWKPKKFDENGEDNEMAVLERKMRAILNKLTPQKFDKLE